MILIREGLDFNPKSVDSDCGGRFLLLEATIQDCPLLIIHIYAPNKAHEQKTFFSKIKRKIDNFDFDSDVEILLGGDLNLYFDENLDCHGGRPKIKEESVN